VLVSRTQVGAFRPNPAGRGGDIDGRKAERLLAMLGECGPGVRREVFRSLRQEFPIHPLESALGIEAEVILEAIARSGKLTLRMIRGVIAEAAFGLHVVQRLAAWKAIEVVGNLPYDFFLDDGSGPVRVQVKLQRSRGDRPMRAVEASRSFDPDYFVVETQRTRGGADRSGGSTRPYLYGEFDILAVSLYPSTGRWDAFRYTVAAWLMPEPANAESIRKFQPVAERPSDDWTDDFEACCDWLRSGRSRTIGGLRT